MSAQSSDRSTPNFWTRDIIAILLFNAAYLLFSAYVAMGRRNAEFAFYLAVMVILGACLMIVHHRARLSIGVLWCLSLWGLLHMAGGLMPVPESWPIDGDIRVLYSWWIIPDLLKYDQLVHVYGFGVTTWVCWQGVRAILADRAHCSREEIQPTFGILLVCVAAGMGFGALNEVVEFIAVLTIPNTNVGGYINTGWDLVSNGIGCVLAALVVRWGSVTKKTQVAS